MIVKEKLDFWLANNYNVLFVGKHGVGKTTVVLDAFNRRGLKWLYYSASTMDPWVDMIGVPKEKIDPETGVSTLELVRPKEFQNDEVEAIFFDEFNRSHKKIRNAVMELIQFKSINGKKFENLKVVWAAINPEDEEDTYDVDRLDPAQEDRFHIKVNVPYKPSLSYFSSKYGKDFARAALSWWEGLPDEQKDKVSPRRLDYAMDIFSNGGDLRDVIPHEANVSKLITTLDNGPVEDSLKKFLKDIDVQGARKWLENENNYAAAVDFLTRPKYIPFFIPLLSHEKLSALVSKNTRVRKHVISQHSNQKLFEEVLESIVSANQNRTLVREIKRAMPENSHNVLGNIPSIGTDPAPAKHCGLKTNPGFKSIMNYERSRIVNSNTPMRINAVRTLARTIPAELDPETATDVLGILNTVAQSSHGSTIKSISDDFFGCLNHVLFYLYGKGLTFDQLRADSKTYPIVSIVKKAKRDWNISKKILHK